MPLTPEQLADRWAAHAARQHPCCWLVGDGLGTQCGLWCGHDCEHTPHVIGDYLPDMPLIHPLHILRLFWPAVRTRRCPFCHTPTACINQFDEGLVIRWYEEQTAGTHWEIAWSFDPCGCRARQLLPVPAELGPFQGEVR